MALDRSPVVKGTLAEEYAKHYYTVEDDIFSIFEHLDTPFLDERLKPGMLVLDAMMGRGRHVIRYAKRGCRVWGNDLNPHMVRIAKAAAQQARVRARFLNLDACRLAGVPAGKFDVTYAMFSSVGTIPGRKRRQRAVSAMARVTKPGGLVILHAHNFLDCFFEPGFRSWALKSALFPQKGLGWGDMVTDYNGLHGMYNHYYTPAELRRSMRAAGLDVVEERYMRYDPPQFIAGPLKVWRADGFIFVGRRRGN